MLSRWRGERAAGGAQRGDQLQGTALNLRRRLEERAQEQGAALQSWTAPTMKPLFSLSPLVPFHPSALRAQAEEVLRAPG